MSSHSFIHAPLKALQQEPPCPRQKDSSNQTEALSSFFILYLGLSIGNSKNSTKILQAKIREFIRTLTALNETNVGVLSLVQSIERICNRTMIITFRYL